METLEVKKVFSGGFLNVFRNRFRTPNGNETVREVVMKDDAVAIVAYDGEGVYLVEQPREAVGEDSLLELPAGTLDVLGEPPLECAKRELIEEIGIEAHEWEELNSFYSTPGPISEKIYMFRATKLFEYPGGAQPSEDEEITIRKFSWEKVHSMIVEGQIKDAKTLVGIFWVLYEDSDTINKYLLKQLEEAE